MFDCVMPTRNARNGQLFTSLGEINIRNSKYKNDQDPIDKNCSCKVCQKYSKGYLNHLDKTNEILASILLSYHNVFFYQNLMQNIRQSIQEHTFANFIKEFYNMRGIGIPTHLV